MPLLESGEMYLETILLLSEQKTRVRAIDISEYMGYSKPSVSRALGILKNDGYITVDADGPVKLTDSGLNVAKTIYERHTVLSEFFMKIGVDRDTAIKDGCKMEHIISKITIEKIKEHMKSFT